MNQLVMFSEIKSLPTDDLSWLPPHMYQEENYLTWGELTACVEGREDDILSHILRMWTRHKNKPFYLFSRALWASDVETVKILTPKLHIGLSVSVVYQIETSLLEIAQRRGLI